MTDTMISPILSNTDTDGLDHFVCCDAVAGTMTIAYCGKEDIVEESYVSDVSCNVCAQLDAVNYCPLRPDHQCRYEADKA